MLKEMCQAREGRGVVEVASLGKGVRKEVWECVSFRTVCSAAGDMLEADVRGGQSGSTVCTAGRQCVIKVRAG